MKERDSNINSSRLDILSESVENIEDYKDIIESVPETDELFPDFESLPHIDIYRSGGKEYKKIYKHGANGPPSEIILFNENDERHGEYLSYHATGQLMKKGEYVNDKKVGKWNHYWENGNIMSEKEYDENGNKIGKERMYNNDGSFYGED